MKYNISNLGDSVNMVKALISHLKGTLNNIMINRFVLIILIVFFSQNDIKYQIKSIRLSMWSSG